MKPQIISNLRLQAQQITSTKFKRAQDIVSWMGAMQAQDYYMSKWAIGIRLPGSTDMEIETALNKGEILRTHLLRPTWHLVAASDIYWMLELTAPQIKAAMKSRHKELELSESIIKKCISVIEKALTGGNHLTREELMDRIQKAKIPTDGQRAAHIMLCAELDQIVCSGISKGKEQTYALLEERVPKRKILKREEALTELAKKYFSSHGPATLQDFVWWSGLSITEAKKALELSKTYFLSEKIDSQTLWFSNSISIPKSFKESAFLLPAFDEFIISYKDRSASLLLINQKKTISNNGIFRPVVVVNGEVIGIWKRTIKKDMVLIEPEYFLPVSKKINDKIEKVSSSFGNFLKRKAETSNKK